MDLRQLRTVIAVTRTGSVSAASATLRIAQPALSRQIGALEAELGTPLFHRSGHGMVATPAGEALADDAARLLEMAEAAKQRARSFGAMPVGEAHIGLSPSMGRRLAVPLVLHAATAFPGIRLRVSEALSGTLLEWLHAGRLDVAIVYHRPSSAAIASEVIGSEALYLLGKPQAPDARATSFRALADRPLVLTTPDHGLRRMIDAQAALFGVRLNVVSAVDSLDAIIALVRQGYASTILPRAAIATELIESGELSADPIRDPELRRSLVLARGAQRATALAPETMKNLLLGALAASLTGEAATE